MVMTKKVSEYRPETEVRIRIEGLIPDPDESGVFYLHGVTPRDDVDMEHVRRGLGSAGTDKMMNRIEKMLFEDDIARALRKRVKPAF